jgi:two-component system CheB/CheR fusion protein
MMYVPIRSSETVLGVLSIQSYTPAAYSPEDLKLLHALADHCGDALQRIRLAAATRELAAIVENSGDAIIAKALDGTILSWNKGAEKLYGYTAEEIKGRSLAVLIPPDQHGDLPAILKRFSFVERTSEFEATRLRKDGARIEISANLSPIRDAAGHVTGASVIERDITERKRLEREIADISQHEQQRLAHELHDHLGAYLTGIAFRMKALAEALDRHAVPEASAARELVKLVNNGTDQVRNFARLIAPVEIANGGLAVALSRLGAEMETLFGIVCRVEVAPDLPSLTDEHALQLYRIAQEAARNAVQHGKARNIEISVRHDPGQLVQTIRNDGQPWAPVKESGKSLGLRIMRYRAGTFGGTLAVQSDSDGQTVVVCQMPLPRTGASDPGVSQPTLPHL